VEAQVMLVRPPSRGAAVVLGIETFLSGTVAGVEGGCTLIRLDPAGPVVRMRTPRGPPFTPGQAATFNLRAASVHLVEIAEHCRQEWNMPSGSSPSPRRRHWEPVS